MRFVIIGASGHYHQALGAVSEGLAAQLTAVAPGSAGEDISGLSEKCPDARVYKGYEEMLDAEKPDAAVVNPYFCDTAKISMECLRRNIHVYSEKPLATTLSDLAALKEAWSESQAELGCMLNLSLCGWFRTIEKSIQNGDIGEVRVLHGQKSYRIGTRGMHYQTREMYGGTIPWVGIHAIDWLLRLGGKCKWVSAVHTKNANFGNGELESAGSVLLALENGVIGTCDIDYFRPVGSDRHDDDRLRVTGTRGTLEAIDGVVTLVNEDKRRVLAPEEGINPFTDFVNAIGAEKAKVLFREAYEDTRISLLARQAADEESIIRTE